MAETTTNWIDFLVSLGPVVQTAIWAGVAVAGAIWLRGPLAELANVLLGRVRDGDSITTPWLSVEKQTELKNLDQKKGQELNLSNKDIPKLQAEAKEEQGDSAQWWIEQRKGIYGSSKDVFLVHAISPSTDGGFKYGQAAYDIFIYLKGHKGRSLDDIDYAEFFLGHYWRNEVYRETQRSGSIGIRTSAYGPFLCVCRISFSDGHKALVSRYIDFEMGSLFDSKK